MCAKWNLWYRNSDFCHMFETEYSCFLIVTQMTKRQHSRLFWSWCMYINVHIRKRNTAKHRSKNQKRKKKKEKKERKKETLCEKRVIYIPCVSSSLSVVCFVPYGPKLRKKHLQTKSRIKKILKFKLCTRWFFHSASPLHRSISLFPLIFYFRLKPKGVAVCAGEGYASLGVAEGAGQNSSVIAMQCAERRPKLLFWIRNWNKVRKRKRR
jgi:hypothetical protein